MQRASLYHLLVFLMAAGPVNAQLSWFNVDSEYAPLPQGFHVYKTTDSLDGRPNIAYYAIANLKDKNLQFTTDTTFQRRLTPTQFFEKNHQPLLVVNCTFFSFETNQNLNLVIRDKKILAHTVRKVRQVKGDTTSKFIDERILRGAIGIKSGRKPDVAWVCSDTACRYVYAAQSLPPARFKRWKMQTAVGGGPVLVQDSRVTVTNEEERMFTGKAIHDKHPRTAMGYTPRGELVVLVIQGRYPGLAEGATLKQEAQILQQLGCQEALNMDGGGSSSLLINGKKTITPSEKGTERPTPAVFLIKSL